MATSPSYATRIPLDDRRSCLQMTFSNGSRSESVLAVRQPESATNEKDDATMERASGSSQSYAPISPEGSLHQLNSKSMQEAVDEEERMSRSSSSITANVICSCASASAVLSACYPNVNQEEGQGESACDGGHQISSGHPKERLIDLEAGEDSVKPAPWRKPYSLRCTPHSLYNPSKYFCHDIKHEQEYFQQILGSSSYGWTNEKHSSYLDFMEAAFLRTVMFEGHAEEVASPYSSELTDSGSSEQASHKEFKVCQNGRWRPVSVPTAPYVGPPTHVAVAVKNPWIKRFRSQSKPKVAPLVLVKDRYPGAQAATATDSAMRREAHI